MHRTSTIVTISAALVVSSGCLKPDGAQATLPGDQLFASCTACHGAAGEGNPVLKAPAIAALPAWYLEAQLTKFKAGIRGGHPDDLEGLRMRPMARQMMNAAEVKAVSAYVASLPAKKHAPSLSGGDAAKGAVNYAVCQACHGPRSIMRSGPGRGATSFRRSIASARISATPWWRSIPAFCRSRGGRACPERVAANADS